MAPYIAALVILIVVILFSVYKGVDGFTVALTDTSTFREFMTRIDATLQRYMLLKQKIDSSAAFNDTLTLPKLKELGFDRAPGETPFSKAISVQLETDVLLLTGIMNMFQKALTDGTIKNTDLLKDARANVKVDSFVKILPSIEEIISKREQYYASKAASTTPTTTPTTTATTTPTTTAATTATTAAATATDASGTAVTAATATDASGTAVSGTTTTTTPSLNMNDLYSALGGVPQALKASKLTYETEEAPETTAQSTREMEERIAKSVATQLKDSLLAKRATIPASASADLECPYATYDSTATAQGKDYTVARPHPGPDMSEYIRKDSIPCWNCSLP